MRKIRFTVGVLLALTALMPLQSCIGKFALSNRVLNWNRQVGSKFVNELVFFAFWILPVYEVTSIADLLVLNSIEFWSGNNPVDTAYSKTVETPEGKYDIACDEKGYTIVAPDGTHVRMEFEAENKTWSVVSQKGEVIPFMTMIDESHVKMVTPDGDFRIVDLSEEGVMAYSAECNRQNFALL